MGTCANTPQCAFFTSANPTRYPHEQLHTNKELNHFFRKNKNAFKHSQSSAAVHNTRFSDKLEQEYIL